MFFKGLEEHPAPERPSVVHNRSIQTLNRTKLGGAECTSKTVSYHKTQNIMPGTLIKLPASEGQTGMPIHTTREMPSKEVS